MSNSYDDKITGVNNDVVETNQHEEGEAGMTKAKWLACFALGLSYTTAFQQGACLGAIVKSIDEALGKSWSTLGIVQANKHQDLPIITIG
jgi:hypothetical protein